MGIMRSLLLWILLGALSCASAPPKPTAPPAASSEPPPEAPTTFAYSFEYNPFVIGLKRNGEPYQGPAVLVGNALERRLSFEQGKAAIEAEFVPQLVRQNTLELQVEGQQLTLLPTGASKVLHCARYIAELQRLDPCSTPLPSPELIPEDCDRLGERAWRDTHDEHQKRFDACYSDLNPATLDRLTRSPAIAPLACPRLLGIAGPSPSEDTAVALWPGCGAFFPEAAKPSTKQSYLLRRLPTAFEAAKTASSEGMKNFYTTYQKVAPKEAQEIRKMAVQRYSPPGLNEARWKVLQSSIEATQSKERRFSLCDTLDETIWIRVQSRQYPSLQDPSFLGYPATKRVIYPRGYSTLPSAAEQAVLRQKTAAILGKRELTFRPNCKNDDLWFLHP